MSGQRDLVPRFGKTRRACGLAAIVVAGASLLGCATHVKGSWSCAMEPGSVCASVSEIDHASAHHAASKSGPDPVIDGAIPARLYSQGGWTAGAIAGAPLRESDPVLKVAIAPWIDEAGDYHAGAEVYGVMRRGSWYVAPQSATRRVDLARLAPTSLLSPSSQDTAATPAAPALQSPQASPAAIAAASPSSAPKP